MIYYMMSQLLLAESHVGLGFIGFGTSVSKFPNYSWQYMDFYLWLSQASFKKNKHARHVFVHH